MADRVTLDSGIQIIDGSIVILARFPDTKWIVHKGWYSYQGNQYNGWYLSSIPSQTTMPLLDSDLIGIRVVGGNCSCPDQPFPSPNPPVPGGGGGLKPEMAWELNRAWITVDTLEQLSRLNRRLIPDGKIVRVNDTGDGTAKYYRYDQAKSIWAEEYFGIDITNYVSKEDLSQEVKDQIDNALPSTVVNVIQTNDEVHQTIKEVADSDLTWRELSE